MPRLSLAALSLAAAAGIPLGLARPAAAQTVAPEAAVLTPGRTEAPPQGATMTATVSQSVETDSNYNLDDPSPGQSYYGDTRIGLAYENPTPNRTLTFGFDTGIRPLWQAGESFEVVVASPSTAYFTYGREGADTLFNLELNARTRQVNANTANFVDTTGDNIPDTLQRGNTNSLEQRYNADIGLTLGTNSPSSYEFRLFATSLNFSNNEDTSLTPNNTVEGQALWTLAITPVFSTAVFGGYTYVNADDPQNSEVNIAEAEAGLVYQPSEVLRVRGGLGYADRHRTGVVDTATGETGTIQDNAGLTMRGDLRYLLPSFTLTGNVRWTAAAPSERLTGAIVGTYILPRGRVTGQVFQNYVAGRNGDEERVTGASFGVTRDINTVSRVGVDFAYTTQVNQDVTDEPDIDRTTLTVSYGYDFTEAITGELGYSFSNRVEDPENASSNRFYFVIGRDFVTGL
jgi:hypothetical protein